MILVWRKSRELREAFKKITLDVVSIFHPLAKAKKKSSLFPVTLPKQVFIQKNLYPKFFSALPTPNQRKTCIKHKFLTKRIMKKRRNYRPTYPIFFSGLITCFHKMIKAGVQLAISPIAKGYRKFWWPVIIFAFVTQLAIRKVKF